jgi:two-component system, NarL family, nitrate/nitrite sensor histidine kinase NarX
VPDSKRKLIWGKITDIMRISQRFLRLSTFWLRILTFVLMLAFMILIGGLMGLLSRFLYGIGSVLVAVSIAWLVGKVRNLTHQETIQENQIRDVEKSLAGMKNRLSGLLRLNHHIINAQDEKELMDSTLEVIADLVGATACSFVPLDEFGQTMPAFTFGNVPADADKIWTENLASPVVRQRCKICKISQPTHDDNCPLLSESIEGDFNLYCISMKREQKILGMLNLYLPIEETLSDDQVSFIEDLLAELSSAVQNIRLRNQELATLRQVQMMHSSKADLSNLLDCLLEGLQNALDVDAACVYVQAVDEWQSEIRLKRGDLQVDDDVIDNLFDQVQKTALAYKIGDLGPELKVSFGFLIVEPLILSDGEIIGILLVAAEDPHSFNLRQMAVLDTVTAQAALLVENERLILSLQFNAIIQERTRLAREIHDGLAQTLAFLKLQSSQMQNYLSQGDFSRLGQVLKQNHQALAEAYLDTRQAIDNLRMSPKLGLANWMEQVTRDFEEVSGIKVGFNFRPPNWDVSPEIQAQLIRIVQEALSNIRKHAHAQHVSISVHEWQDDLIVEVRDDGQGFSAEDVPEVTRYGLRGMRERAELIGADFQIISQPRKGTTVRLQLPRFQEASV